MNISSKTEQVTTYRDVDRINISTYSIEARDPYGVENRQMLEVIGNGDQIMDAMVRFIENDHRWVTNNTAEASAVALARLQRLAGAMGLAYVVKTEEA